MIQISLSSIYPLDSGFRSRYSSNTS
ncbi:hypothetical protein YPPY66_4814, partial [Yersinia pestis PY-66]